MKNQFKIWGILAALLVSLNSLAQKPAVVADSEPGWHRIGGLNASFKKQNESIHVMGNDEFKALKLKIKDGPIHISRMQVFYESGDMEDISVEKEMKEGESSGALQLKHAGRDITKIAFTYHTAANDNAEKAEVEIYGLKTNATASDSYDKKVDKAEGDLKEAREEGREEARETKREAKDAADDVDDEADKTESDVERAAERTGDEVSETAAKTAAEIDDKRHDTKVGPDGQVIYISDDDRYYYVNEEGKKVYVTELQLRDK